MLSIIFAEKHVLAPPADTVFYRPAHDDASLDIARRRHGSPMLYWTAVSPGQGPGPLQVVWHWRAEPSGRAGRDRRLPTSPCVRPSLRPVRSSSSILAMVSSAGQGCALGAEDARAAVTGIDGV
jgi:hypothetical protein